MTRNPCSRVGMRESFSLKTLPQKCSAVAAALRFFFRFSPITTSILAYLILDDKTIGTPSDFIGVTFILAGRWTKIVDLPRYVFSLFPYLCRHYAYLSLAGLFLVIYSKMKYEQSTKTVSFAETSKSGHLKTLPAPVSLPMQPLDTPATPIYSPSPRHPQGP